jgi:hypothetical protein
MSIEMRDKFGEKVILFDHLFGSLGLCTCHDCDCVVVRRQSRRCQQNVGSLNIEFVCGPPSQKEDVSANSIYSSVYLPCRKSRLQLDFEKAEIADRRAFQTVLQTPTLWPLQCISHSCAQWPSRGPQPSVTFSA